MDLKDVIRKLQKTSALARTPDIGDGRKGKLIARSIEECVEALEKMEADAPLYRGKPRCADCGAVDGTPHVMRQHKPEDRFWMMQNGGWY
jgi:hypothetical protein